MVSIERLVKKTVDFFDEQETPVFYTPSSDYEVMVEQIRTLQIFNEVDPEPTDWEGLKKAKTALDAALYQVHSLIEMVEMCKSTDTASAFNTDILSITNRKFLNLKYLESHKPVQNNWEERLSLKYKGFIAAAKLIEDKEKLMQKYNQQQKIFTQKLLEISKRWKIIQQGNNIFAVVGKNFQGEDYKVMLLKDPESGIKVEMANELKKLKVLKVTVFCPEISLNEVQLPKSFGFEDLEKAEQLLIDGEISKEIHEKITENKEYSIQKYTKNEVVLLVNSEEEITIKVSFENTENYSRNNVAKSVIQKLFLSKSDDSDLLIQFCRVLAHVHIKLYVYSIIIQTLESVMPMYRIKENNVNKFKTVYTLIRKPSKFKIVEIEVVGNELFSTAYNLLCFANFIPVVPRAKVMIREISDLIKSTISVQDAYLSLLRS